jgi:hypothetical protein
MHKILFVCLISISLFGFYAKSSNDFYQIIHVNGVVLTQKTQTPLKIGMKIENHEQLLFKTTDASLIVSNQNRGRFIIKSPSQKNAKGELVAFAKDVVLPFTGNTNLSTRGNGAPIRYFNEYLGDTTFYIIGSKLEFEVDHTKYAISPNQFFQLRYQWNDSTKVVKLPHTNNQVVLDGEKLFGNSSPKIANPQKFELFWVVVRPRSVEKLAVFYPKFLDEETLKAEYTVLFDLIANQRLSESEYHKHIYGYFQDVYGKTDENALTNWLEANFKN